MAKTQKATLEKYKEDQAIEKAQISIIKEFAYCTKKYNLTLSDEQMAKMYLHSLQNDANVHTFEDVISLYWPELIKREHDREFNNKLMEEIL
jgi:hypothetical protein